MMKDLLVGATGFVGGNLLETHKFSSCCHSTDIEKYYGMCPDLCIYAGIPSAMYLANTDPDADYQVIENALDNIYKIKPEKLVLVSTTMVYADNTGKNEDNKPCLNDLKPYGYNRLILEQRIREVYSDALILRLPALYGKGLKKNFLYDLHTIIPKFLNEERYNSIAGNNKLIRTSYAKNQSGFYEVVENADTDSLRKFFEDAEFNALSFTDSRSIYQFYNLKNLWHDIQVAIENNVLVLNVSTPPVSAKVIFTTVTGKESWENILDQDPVKQDMRTKHCSLYGHGDGYFCSPEEELLDIVEFMRDWE